MEDKSLPHGKISTPNQLGHSVRQKRKLANLTQTELADLSFVGTRFISELENGKPTLEIGKVLQVLDTLGLEFHLSPTATQPLIDLHSETPTQKPGYRLLNQHHFDQFIQNQQTAIPVLQKDHTLFLPLNGGESSHTLKLAPLRFKSAISNEIFCRLLAKAIGLSTPTIQALPLYPNAFLISHLKESATEGLIKKQKCHLEWIIFNYLIGNAHRDPLNNLLCTTIYPDFSPTLSVAIGGESRYELISKSHWIRFANDIRIKPRFVLDTLKQLTEKILTVMEKVCLESENNFTIDTDVIQKICHVIESRNDVIAYA